MSTPVRLAVFLVILGIVFGLAFALGGAVDPIHDAPAPGHGHVR